MTMPGPMDHSGERGGEEEPTDNGPYGDMADLGAVPEVEDIPPDLEEEQGPPAAPDATEQLIVFDAYGDEFEQRFAELVSNPPPSIGDSEIPSEVLPTRKLTDDELRHMLAGPSFSTDTSGENGDEPTNEPASPDDRPASDQPSEAAPDPFTTNDIASNLDDPDHGTLDLVAELRKYEEGGREGPGMFITYGDDDRASGLAAAKELRDRATEVVVVGAVVGEHDDEDTDVLSDEEKSMILTYVVSTDFASSLANPPTEDDPNEQNLQPEQLEKLNEMSEEDTYLGGLLAGLRNSNVEIFLANPARDTVDEFDQAYHATLNELAEALHDFAPNRTVRQAVLRRAQAIADVQAVSEQSLADQIAQLRESDDCRGKIMGVYVNRRFIDMADMLAPKIDETPEQVHLDADSLPPLLRCVSLAQRNDLPPDDELIDRAVLEILMTTTYASAELEPDRQRIIRYVDKMPTDELHKELAQVDKLKRSPPEETLYRLIHYFNRRLDETTDT